MKSIKERIKAYTSKKSKFGIASDIVFVAILIALLFPTSRNELIVGVKKLLLFQPGLEKNIEELGEKDYNWSIQNLDGEIIPFSEFQGKTIFLNTWATWCPHCIAEFPSIQRLYDVYGKDIEFVILSNENPSIVQAFLDKEGYDFPVYLTYDAMPVALESRSLPTTFIISPKGEILINKKGSAKWDGDKVKALIDDLLSK